LLGLGFLPLGMPQPAQTHHGPQLERSRLLLTSDTESLVQTLLRFCLGTKYRGLGAGNGRRISAYAGLASACTATGGGLACGREEQLAFEAIYFSSPPDVGRCFRQGARFRYLDQPSLPSPQLPIGICDKAEMRG